jgi:hypothetical protein
MFGGKVEIKKDSYNVVFMTGMEDGRLLKLKRTSSHAKNASYLSHNNECIKPSSLLLHARFDHINDDSLLVLKKNGVSSLPTIPRKLKQCDACILGKHNKQPFHDYTSRACRKLELIHSDLCGPMPIPSTNENKYIMSFVEDYIRMFWVYLVKEKSQDFNFFLNFMYIFKMKHNLVLAFFALIMEKVIHLMNFKAIFANMGSSMKPSSHTILNRKVWLNE